jgi:hypothetical protein
LHSRPSSIATQVSLIGCGILVAAILAFSLIAYFRTAATLDRRSTEDLAARVSLFEAQLGTFDSSVKHNTDRLASIFESMLGGTIRVDERPARSRWPGRRYRPSWLAPGA